MINMNLQNRKYINRALRFERNRMVRVITIVIFVALAITIGNAGIGSNAMASSGKEKKILSIKIDKKDTLWSVAKEYADLDYYKDYNEYIDEVKEINHIYNSQLRAGSYIVVPCYE